MARQQTTALMVIACETLQDTAGVLKESQREMLLLTLVEKVKSADLSQHHTWSKHRFNLFDQRQ